MPLPKREAFIHDPLRLTLQQHGVCSSRGDKAPARMISACCEVLFHSGEQSNTFCFLWNVAELFLSLWKVGSSVTCPGRRLVAGQGTGVAPACPSQGTVASLGEGVWVCLPCPAPPTPCRANAAPLPPLSPLLPPALWLLPRVAAAAECGFIALLCEGKCERVIKDGKSQNFKPKKIIKDGISKNFKTN